ncbi:MAG: hypothetical protein JWO63_367, partial [Frankiales bacterium]|nr:hypothetical protein [Frankiales bacterium]
MTATLQAPASAPPPPAKPTRKTKLSDRSRQERNLGWKLT